MNSSPFLRGNRQISRRAVLKSGGLAAGASLLASLPLSTGLFPENEAFAATFPAQATQQPSGRTGWQPLSAKQFRSITAELAGISKRTMEEHYALYQGYVNKTNEIMAKLEAADLKSANQVYSELRVLKVELSFAIGGVKNHEIYFEHLGGHGGAPEGALAQMIRRDFGSFENWAVELKATGLAARGWVWLAYDHDWGRLANYLGDAQNTFPVWNATPILALDTYEHAYWIDFGRNRGAYIDAFLRNLDWSVLAANFEKGRK